MCVAKLHSAVKEADVARVSSLNGDHVESFGFTQSLKCTVEGILTLWYLGWAY